MMKIMYCKYMRNYEEITLEELKYRTSFEYKKEREKYLDVFFIILDEIKDGVLYFSEIDAHDW